MKIDELRKIENEQLKNDDHYVNVGAIVAAYDTLAANGSDTHQDDMLASIAKAQDFLLEVVNEYPTI